MSGKMSFYPAAVDDLLRHPDDQPSNAKRGASNGLILCKSKSRTIVEYALRNINRPIGVSTYKIWESLPDTLKNSLPSIEQLELEMDTLIEEGNR